MKLRDDFREAARRTNEEKDWKMYRKERNLCTKMLKNKKNEHFKKKFETLEEEKNVKGIYNTAKNVMGWNMATQPNMLISGGLIFRSPLDMANVLQKTFKNKVENLMRGLKRGGRDPLRLLNEAMFHWEGSESMTTFTIREISLRETLSHISKLGNTTAVGREGLDAKSVKVAAALLAPPINHLINISIRTGRFANKWKISRIIPIVKSKESRRSDPTQYRPVALLPTISKLIERTVQTQLQSHMENMGLLNRNSHAYRENLSTATAIMQLIDRLYESSDRNLISELMALDQSAAFDCVNVEILLRKLEKYKCSSNTIKWMKSYLTSRSQYTNLGRHNSEMIATTRGVPQGSILGPLLYIIYTNELSQAIKNKNCTDSSHSDKSKLFGQNCNICGTLVTYADDATLHIASNSRESNKRKMIENLDNLEKFLNDNDLVINVGKTAILECMIRQKRGRMDGEPPNLTIEIENGTEKVIKDKKELRILGTNVQHNLGWISHLEKGHKAILPAARKQFGSIQQVGKMLPKASRKLLAEGLVISKLYYIMSQWGGTTNNNIMKAQRLQNKVARWITGSGKRTRISTLMEQVGWFTILEQVKIHSLTQIWKIINLARPELLRENIELTEDNLISTNKPRLQLTKLGFLWRTSKYWNNLPLDLRMTKTLPGFKRKLKNWTKERREIEPD